MQDDVRLEELKGKDLGREPCGLGKFEGNFNCSLAKALYDTVMEGGVDDEIGDAEDFGWFGKVELKDLNIKEDGQPIAGAIVSQGSMGFFTYKTYPRDVELEQDWDEILAEAQDYYGEEEE